MPYKKTIVLLIIGLFASAMCIDANAFETGWRDAQSPVDWSKGDYEQRQRIERQWQIEDDIRDLRREREEERFRRQLDEKAQDEADRLGYEKTW